MEPALNRVLGSDKLRGRRERLLALLAEAHLLGKIGARLSIGRRDHRIVVRQAPLGEIILRRQIVF